MQLITGGLGFIGSHTARALLDLGEDCVVTQHSATQVPDYLQLDLGARLVVEPVDVENAAALLQIGDRHTITGIVHLADAATHRLWNHAGSISLGRLDGLFDSLFHVLHAAHEWGVTRVTIASTIGVYAGVAPGRWSEETALPMVAAHAIPTAKKCTELLATLISDQIGIAAVHVRPSAIWGPGGRAQSSFFALPALVHAAVHGETESPSIPQPLYAGDATDACYVKDCARAIALIQTAPTLTHRTYNIGSGRTTSNEQIVTAIRRMLPDATFTLTDGRNPHSPPIDPFLDLTQIHQDTGYEPAYDIDTALADYINWLRTGHDR
jgi:UDP-glucose 4-epimerase